MPFEEALERFMHTKPKEVEASIEKSKQKKPGLAKKKKPGSKSKLPGDASQSPTVVALRDKRKR
jgi:hypothetical protein